MSLRLCPAAPHEPDSARRRHARTTQFRQVCGVGKGISSKRSIE
ncbi:hypothetical protein HMPREF0580_1572 [Mobiluncus mulieris ATCC 35239]|uniref:Uncharacterized protein n=1 Tax=Mobiluncus mulieris ATCC 35239 TaxID=871571 RepID=E0QRQ7_9ACTO|nr:hypothetical protein HMPREF0577_0908 [Mobiluncus mulieris ATCC 35243]EFM45765.1 hypothetical protein HMPREF0580_1572 [Mobiluncus mulieris ATCC 35239]